VRAGAARARGGMLQMGMVFAAIAWWGRRGPRSGAGRWHVAVALGAFVCGAVVMPWFIDAEPLGRTAVARMLEASEACSSRLVLWSNVLDLVAQRPWFGWGWGELDYAHYITPYVGPRFCDILDNAHNLPLHLAVELGVPIAMLATLAAVAWVLRHRPWQEQDHQRQMAWLVLGLIGVHSMVEYPLWTGPFFGAALVALMATSTAWRRPMALTTARVTGALLALAGLTMAWDYARVSQIYLHPAQRSAAYQQDTLAKVSATWLFKDQAQFAELTTTPLTRANAQHMAALAEHMLHFSPESRVVEVLVESLVLLGRDAEAQVHLARFRAVFPRAYAAWQQTNSRAASGLR
jgi:O-antigen ligase